MTTSQPRYTVEAANTDTGEVFYILDTKTDDWQIPIRPITDRNIAQLHADEMNRQDDPNQEPAPVIASVPVFCCQLAAITLLSGRPLMHVIDCPSNR